MKIFGTSGIRRVADRELIELAFKVGLTVGSLYKNMVIGRDTRTSGDAVKHSLISGLLASGAYACDMGIIPTPTLALAARKHSAGAMITASHNPPEYNGIKLINPDGSAFDAEQQAEVEEIIAGDLLPAVGWEDITRSNGEDGIIEMHIQQIMRKVSLSNSIKVVLDCGCGAGSVITPELLKRMGCRVSAINSYPSGFFPRAVEPTESNLENLIRVTKELDADLGIAHDGDADRMMAVDDRGRFIPGDKLMALFSRDCRAKKVVTTVDASIVIDEIGFEVVRTPVGDSFVSVALRDGGEFGGEPSGSWSFPENSLCPDGIYAAARLCAIASRSRISELLDQIPQYPIIRGSLPGYVDDMEELEQQLLALGPDSVDRTDGIKLNFRDGWLLVRPSGTEPKIRLTSEARTQAEAQCIYDSAEDVVNKSTGQKATASLSTA